jgi:Tfp pilus assembly protein PilF
MRLTTTVNHIVICMATALMTCTSGVSLADDQPSAWQALEGQARISFGRGQLDEAESEYRDALKTAEQAGAVEPGVVTCLVGLAYVNDRKGNTGESERLYELAMRNMEGLVGPNDPRFADWMPDLAFLYDSHGKPDKAEVLFKRAWRIKQTSYGPNDARVAGVLEQYAKFLRKNGRDAEALDLESRARAIKQKQNS